MATTNDVYAHLLELRSAVAVLDSKVTYLYQTIVIGRTQEMLDLQSLKTAVAAEATVVQSTVTLLGGISAQIAALAANAADPAEIQALADSVNAQKDALAAAVAAVPTPAPAQ